MRTAAPGGSATQNRRQKVFNRGALKFCGVCLCGVLDITKLTKIPLVYSVSRFNLGGLGALFGGAKPTKAPPWRRDWCNTVLLNGLGLMWMHAALLLQLPTDFQRATSEVGLQLLVFLRSDSRCRLYMSDSLCERSVQTYFKVFGLRAERQVFTIEVCRLQLPDMEVFFWSRHVFGQRSLH